MKRKWAKKVKANSASIKQQARMTAMIGLIVSTGATHLILTRQGDSTPADQPLAQQPMDISAKTEAGFTDSNANLVEPKAHQVTVAALSRFVTPTPYVHQQETVENPAHSAIEHKEQTRQTLNQQAQSLRVDTGSNLTHPELQESLASSVTTVSKQNLSGQSEQQNKKLLQILRTNRLVRQLKHSQIATKPQSVAVNPRLASPTVVASSQIETEELAPGISEDKSTWSAKQRLLIGRLKQENRLQNSLAQLSEKSKSSVPAVEKTEPTSNYQKENQPKTASSLGLLPGVTSQQGKQINSQQFSQPATVFVIPAITTANNQPSVVSEYGVTEQNRAALKHRLALLALLKANNLNNSNSTSNTVGQNIAELKNPKQLESSAVAPSVNVSYGAMGGDILDDDSVQASPPANVEEIQQAQTAAAQALQSNQYFQLQTDIDKLRQKYQTQSLVTAQALPIGTQTITTPATAARTEEKLLLKIRSQISTNQPINPEFNPNHAAKTLQLDEQKQQPIQGNAGKVIKHGLATAPSGTDAASLRSFQGQNVSPELPPLGGLDNYLPKPLTVSAKGLIWPARGKLTSGYGWRWGRMHKGVDIAAPIGTPIMAVAPGVVVKAGWNSGGYGNLVDIQHSDGTVTRYAHNKRLLVHKGEAVQQGQQISEMGNTGFSTGPHLHFEVHPMGKKAVNPIAYLPR